MPRRSRHSNPHRFREQRRLPKLSRRAAFLCAPTRFPISSQLCAALLLSTVGHNTRHRVRYFGCARDVVPNVSTSTMNREYHRAYSQELHRDIEALVFGHAGTPLLVFPTSRGRFFEYEDRGVIGVLAPKIEHGELQVFCPDAVDTESWYNKGVHPRVRVLRHLQYERYLLHEFLPFIRWKNQTPRLAVTGCSFGGYHAVNFALKHPDVVTHCVSMSGSFDIHQFLDGYYDNDCYFNNPPDFLPNMSDDWFLSRYRQMKIVLGSADWDICLDQNVKFSAILNGKAIPHWLDVWGDNSKHDWPLWLRMAAKYF
jgi:esterase/lipase superfamily enzyme